MAMLHIHAYPCRSPEDIELLVCPGYRGGLARSVVRSLRDHAASPFMPPPVAGHLGRRLYCRAGAALSPQCNYAR